MSNVIKTATNKFTKGLVMDFSPENTSNEVLSHALNATLLTFNGNEMSLQNDMGNARVETAYLPEGYMPVGTCEYGGIIYIVSYNPLEDKSQIGCFPSPERNVSNEELGISNIVIEPNFFQNGIYKDGEFIPDGTLKSMTYNVLLRNDNLNPGDKFIISSTDSIYNERLLDLTYRNNNELTQTEHPIIALNIVSIEDNGKINYLNSDLRQYEHPKLDKIYSYHIVGETSDIEGNTQKIDIDSYRNILSSGYNVFKSKTSGKLAILAELITIDSYAVTHSIIPSDSDETKFDIIIHTDVSPEINENNYLTAPKLSHYYLDNLDCKIFRVEKNSDELKSVSLFTNKDDFLNTELNQILNVDLLDEKYLKTLSTVSKFEFPENNTYHTYTTMPKYNPKESDWNELGLLITQQKNIVLKFEKNKQYLIDTFYQFTDNRQWLSEISADFYVYYMNEDTKLISVQTLIDLNFDNPDTIEYRNILIIPKKDFYVNILNFIPHINNNFQLFIVHSEFIPNPTNNYKYNDVKLASIKIPEIIQETGSSFNCIYNYRLTPCMNYGKLDYLSVSNSINFNNLYDFEKSNFNIWKYRIDGNQLRLTFGAEIFDTTETYKVDALILEFYDLWGFVGSLEITDKKSYSGSFTKIIQLNTLDGLHKKKIYNNDYIENYVHNINIINQQYEYEDESGNKKIGYKYVYNSKDIKHDPETGWNIDDNDCGTLYSNMIYGIKAYWRQTTESGYKFIENKENFFLFTFPIYNEYYYIHNNFNTLVNPELNLVLSYKLQNSSNIYDTDETINNLDPESNTVTKIKIENGYDTYNPNDPNDITKKLPSDKENYEIYIQGIYEGQKLELIKYYTYEGTTNLSLEIGLKKEYEEFDMGYDPKINNYFSCNLQLLSNRELEKNNEIQTCFSIDSTNTSTTNLTELLNYTDHNKALIWENKLGFDKSLTENNDKDTQNILINSGFENYNFNNQSGTKNIPINYKFIIGYKTYIYNIQSSTIPITTVTSLLHKKDTNSDYNYSDFSIYVAEDGETLYSDAIYYNGGTAINEEFGICKQISKGIKTEENPNIDVRNICTKIAGTITEARDIKSRGYMNSESMSKFTPLIGKLTFCMPHLHNSFNENYGVNIHLNNEKTELNISNRLYDFKWNAYDKESNNYAFLNWEGKGSRDSTLGIAPSNEYFSNPRFNLVLNTYQSLEQNSEFISTLDYKVTYGRQRGFDLHNEYCDAWTDYKTNGKDYPFKDLILKEFVGLTAEQLPEFNKQLLQTVKGIYAYNPDYDTMDVNIGNILIENLETKFISNIISSNATLNIENSFNNYIGIKNVYLNKYFELLTEHSSIKTINDENSYLPVIDFHYNLNFCGGNENYLISQLTYNTPIPSKLEQELTFNNDEEIHIIHSTGYRTKLQGNLNKKALYAFVSNRLIQLDVSNYKIADDGTLGLYYDTDYIVSGYIDDDINCENNILNKYLVETEGVDTTNGNKSKIYKVLYQVSKKSKSQSRIGVSLTPTINTNLNLTQGGLTRYDPTTGMIVFYPGESWGQSGGSTTTTTTTTNGTTLTTVMGKLDQTYKDYLFAVDYGTESIVSSSQTVNYSKIENGKYKLASGNHHKDEDEDKYVYNEEYSNAAFRGTSLTINDLYYDPNSNHRLFIKNLSSEKCRYEESSYNNNNIFRNIIYYRELPLNTEYNKMSDIDKNIVLTWNALEDPTNAYLHKNHLYLFTGPCFTPETLIYE